MTINDEFDESEKLDSYEEPESIVEQPVEAEQVASTEEVAEEDEQIVGDPEQPDQPVDAVESPSVDVDNPESMITINSPMAEAALKGCHPIQNLGAVETYTRRYLWVTALELVEHDAIDASEPIKEVDLTDYESALDSAVDLKNLMDIWQTIPKEHHKALKGKAAEVKARLS